MLWFRKDERISLSEWMAGMRALNEEMPLPAPKFRTKDLARGKEGVCYPEKPQRKVVAMKRRSGQK